MRLFVYGMCDWNNVRTTFVCRIMNGQFVTTSHSSGGGGGGATQTESGGVSTRTVSWNLLVFIVDMFYVVLVSEVVVMIMRNLPLPL